MHYWAARALGGEFTANREVDEMEWLPISEALGPTQLSR